MVCEEAGGWDEHGRREKEDEEEEGKGGGGGGGVKDKLVALASYLTSNPSRPSFTIA